MLLLYPSLTCTNAGTTLILLRTLVVIPAIMIMHLSQIIYMHSYKMVVIMHLYTATCVLFNL